MSEEANGNPLEDLFDRHTQGPGIWKWRHYFEIYDRHFRAFRGRDVHLLEIGVYSGGSLSMWKEYLGPRAHIYGIDIQQACKSYETDRIKILIGDQSDRSFWARFRQQVPVLDLVVDDGSHDPRHQGISIQELLPHLRPGGAYLCEDVTGNKNPFASYVHELAHLLNAYDGVTQNLNDNERRLVYKTTEIQAMVNSVHCYPFITVVEKQRLPPAEFVAPKHGTQWEPFLS